MSRFLDALRSGRPLLMDGAMGTELQRAGLATGECGELWNLAHPEVVRAVHQFYADAGAEVHLTNTFQAVRASTGWRPGSPAPTRYDERRALIVLQWTAYALARSACGPDGFVLGDVGSYTAADTGHEFSDLTLLRPAVQALGPVDGVLLETCSTPRAFRAVAVCRKLRPELPVLLSLTYHRDAAGDLVTLSGHRPEWYAERAAGHGVAALGVNCGREVGMDEIIEVTRRYRGANDLPLFARPNAGTPKQVGKGWKYPHTAAKMAARVQELLAAGAVMVGGCCGTGPGHIAAFGRAMSHRQS
jgi:methionine synthase I (cobalamin-dependent)